jgi:hypothetical protein
MIDYLEWSGLGIALGVVSISAYVLLRALWGAPEEGGSEWASALAPELAPSPVEVIRIEPRAVEHVGASEAAPAAGAIGTLAERPSDDLLTFEQQVTGEPDEWAWFEEALVAYEDALLTRHAWAYTGFAEVERMDPIGLHFVPREQAFESTQQRIDRWLSEGGDGVRAARADARMAVSDTWDAPSQELPLLYRYASDSLAEALLAS